MKKAITMILASAMVTSMLAGCSSGSKTATTATSSEVKSVSIGCTIYKFDDTFLTGVRNSISAAATAAKAKVEIVDSTNSSTTQNEKIELFITKKVNSLEINPVDSASAGAIITKAKSANIPVVFFNRMPSASDMNTWDKVYYVGAKPEQSGIMQGKILAAYWKANPKADTNKDGIMDYVMITGEPGHPDAIARTKASIAEIVKEGIKVNLVATDTGMWDRVKAQDKMQSILAAKGNKVEAVLANNDDMALGAISALKAAGYFKGTKYMPVVGVDATAPGIAALADGSMLGTVLNDAKNQGIATFNISKLLAEGKVPTSENAGYTLTDKKYVWIDYKQITKANMSDAK
ncbi:galactose ABC transporter substrate-binding protein [Clostridium estertheticum]|uniref:galactose ABC transporter substrate-binding protein n=1 Tax=Clostridium estertheticum TaxID=238834 RepID=UPI001C7D50DF|nr:galactose ABC transporter substrate-binding protein [Clostridium estertheticum]MBX4267346.1 galactose ABC transporter substrate-binding protein [Clostridium estertheticum]MBX4271883.1 galactose ABC transporter substrate-binding protein [Clostridium estertheticum]WLC79789.1 galactose ABC transporter substrate-binding protein [Clostridium estertheticum]WLC86893.1 galactose ABC transporter substrate-binding protein [Clostridium estertheticum]